MKSAYDEAVRLLPSKTAAALGERFKTAEEFRLRAGRYPCALIGGREEAIADRAVTRDDIACVLEKATNASLPAVWQDISKGFISCGFGLRIGVCGTGVISGGKLTGLRDISSVSIRIPRQSTNCGGEVLKKLCAAKDNVLIISPPGGGKTTFLRECIRAISNSGVVLQPHPCRNMDGLCCSPFARHYWGNHCLFSFPAGTKMFQFPALASCNAG